MKINASMLYHQIQKYFDVDTVLINNNNYAKTLIFYNSFFDMNEHIVIANEANIVQCVGRVNRSIIICLNHVENIPDVGSNDLIILNDIMSENMAFNILNYILDIYNEWEIQLNDIVYNHHDFQALIESVNKIIELPIALFDSNYRYIAYSEDSNTETHLKYVDNDKNIPVEQVNTMHENPDFEKYEKELDAFLYPGEETTVYKNIFHNGKYVARLAVLILDDSTDIEYCKSVFNSAAPFIETLYDTSNNYAYTSIEYRLMHQYMENVFESKLVERESFFILLKKLGCLDTDYWQIFVLIPFNANQLLYSLSYTCFQLENAIPGMFCVSMNNSIICMVDLDYYEKNSKQDFFQRFTQFISYYYFVGGASRKFTNPSSFENMFVAKTHAEYAFDNGPILKYGELSYFQDYACDYLLTYGSNGLSANQICHPAILKLKDYDRLHKTEYTYTLYQYMKNNMNAVATAKSLFIHRSSFINRMERINSLINLNLSDYKERLYIDVSFDRFYTPPENKK